MLKRLIAFLAGHLRIEVTGRRLERFLNLALEQGIILWNIRRAPDRMRASITIRDFFALRPVCRGAHCRVHILGRYGLPFRVVKLRRRPVLVAGFLACLAFMYWGSSHVWIVKVKVTGPQNLDPRAVRAVAGEAGLRVGVWRDSVDLKRVQQHIQERMGEVSMAVVRVTGTKADIEVVEKAARNLPNQSACVNLHARKDGVIEEVVPFQGEPVVKKGDIVKAGDLLVECSFKYWGGGRPLVVPGTEKPPRDAVARTIIAQALVRARITYSQYMEIPLVQQVQVPTGRTASQWVLNWKNQPIILRGKDGIPFAHYREVRKTYALGSWRNWKPPVELVILHTEEVVVRTDRIPVATALSQATDKLSAQLRWLLGPSDKILTPPRAEVVEQGKDFVGVRVTVETLEEIAAPREGTPPPPQPPAAQPAQP